VAFGGVYDPATRPGSAGDSGRVLLFFERFDVCLYAAAARGEKMELV
jgi:hypothetical protein